MPHLTPADRSARFESPPVPVPIAGRCPASPPRLESLTLAFDDNRLLASLFGEHDQHLALIEQRLGVDITPRGNRLSLRGTPAGARQCPAGPERLYDRARAGLEVTRGDVEGAIRMRSIAGPQPAADRRRCASAHRGASSSPPRTPRPARLYPGHPRHELVFGIGPAGTGKTYLAVAHARARLLRSGEVDRLISVAPGGRGRRAPRLPARRHEARRSTPICARSTTRSTT